MFFFILFLFCPNDPKSYFFYGAVLNGSLIVPYNSFPGVVFSVGETVHEYLAIPTLHNGKDIISRNTMDKCRYFPHGHYFATTVLECQGT